MLTVNLYILVIYDVITVDYCKCILLYSSLNSYLYVHWILDFKLILLLNIIRKHLVSIFLIWRRLMILPGNMVFYEIYTKRASVAYHSVVVFPSPYLVSILIVLFFVDCLILNTPFIYRLFLCIIHTFLPIWALKGGAYYIQKHKL